MLRTAGTVPAHGKDAARKRAATNLELQRLNREWDAGNEPSTTAEEYRERILPGLASVNVKVIAQALVVSEGNAGQIRKGEKVPHPRHWTALGRLSNKRPNH